MCVSGHQKVFAARTRNTARLLRSKGLTIIDGLFAHADDHLAIRTFVDLLNADRTMPSSITNGPTHYKSLARKHAPVVTPLPPRTGMFNPDGSPVVLMDTATLGGHSND